LNDLDRIANWEYFVTDDDIVRARLRTVGIQEYRLVFKNGPRDNPKGISLLSYSNDIYLTVIVADQPGWEWRIFDVGGCRTLVSDQ
jgi:guanine nucleotide-binding protein alpha-1 subunit